MPFELAWNQQSLGKNFLLWIVWEFDFLERGIRDKRRRAIHSFQGLLHINRSTEPNQDFDQ